MGGKLFRNFSFLSATISFFILIGIFSILFLYAQDAISELDLIFSFTMYGEVARGLMEDFREFWVGLKFPNYRELCFR